VLTEPTQWINDDAELQAQEQFAQNFACSRSSFLRMRSPNPAAEFGTVFKVGGF
jgi:hypothetical protein